MDKNAANSTASPVALSPPTSPKARDENRWKSLKSNPSYSKFIAKLENTYNHCVGHYENTQLHQKVKDVVPVEKLKTMALESARKEYGVAGIILKSFLKDIEDKMPEDKYIQEELLKHLLHWFKTEFFKWTDAPKCAFCQVIRKTWSTFSGSNQVSWSRITKF